MAQAAAGVFLATRGGLSWGVRGHAWSKGEPRTLWSLDIPSRRVTVFPTHPSLPVTSPTSSQRIKRDKAQLTVPGVPGDDHHRRGRRARTVAGGDADLVRAPVKA